MHPWEFYRYTMQDFMYKRDGARKYAWEQQKDRWEMARELAFTIANMADKALPANTTKENYWPFSWDKDTGLSQIEDATARREYILELRRQYLAAAKAASN